MRGVERRVLSPCKLMVAGEYSVLIPGGAALAVAVSPALDGQLGSDSRDLLTAPALGLESVPLASDGETRFAFCALEAVREQGVLREPVHIRVDGGLRFAGEKVGLGESAAVVAGIVRIGILDTPLSDSEGVALAIRAHRKASGGTGSGYDVATSFGKGVTVFSPGNSPQTATLRWPEGLFCGVGFSGRGVSTRALLKRFSDAGSEIALQRMRTGAQELIAEWRGGGRDNVLAALEPLDAYLQEWSENCGVTLMTPELQEMKGLAAELGGVTRIAGAGGGDSLWVFGKDESRVEAVLARWEGAGYSRLPVARFLPINGTTVSL